ncbi:hypothetical protein Tco_1482054 [Tanacetum coccineum]
MEAHLTPKQPIQVNKITSVCEICSGPHDTQYCMENPEQAFVDYASLHTNKAGGLVSNFMASQDVILSKFEADFKQQQSEMTNKIDSVLKAITDRIMGALPSDTIKNPKLNVNPIASVLSAQGGEQEEKYDLENINTNPSSPPDSSSLFVIEKVRKLNSFLESLTLVPQSSDKEYVCTKGDDGDVMRELAYHKYLMSGPIPSIFMRNPIITEGCPSNLKIPCNIGQVHVGKAYIDLNFPLNVMTQMFYNWIMRRKLDPRGDPNRGVSNFKRRIKGMHVFVGNFTYVIDFMIIKDISSIIDPRLSQVVLGKPFVEMSNMTHDPSGGVVRFTNRINEITYKMPYKIEQYNSRSDLEKEHTKSVYLRNEEDKKRGVEYVMSKILGFYKEF